MEVLFDHFNQEGSWDQVLPSQPICDDRASLFKLKGCVSVSTLAVTQIAKAPWSLRPLWKRRGEGGEGYKITNPWTPPYHLVGSAVSNRQYCTMQGRVIVTGIRLAPKEICVWTISIWMRNEEEDIILSRSDCYKWKQSMQQAVTRARSKMLEWVHIEMRLGRSMWANVMNMITFLGTYPRDKHEELNILERPTKGLYQLLSGV